METESDIDGQDGDLLLWILVWSELAAFGALLIAFMLRSVMDGASPFLLQGRRAS